jgi:hypothetical protein
MAFNYTTRHKECLIDNKTVVCINTIILFSQYLNASSKI